MVPGCAPVEEGGEVVNVTLEDFGVTLDRSTVPSGTVTFAVKNEGPSLHEIEIFAGAEAGRVLEVDRSVADATGLELVDEVENVLSGSTTRLTVRLEPGTYLVVCNLPDHYQQGMWTYLTVTG
jgi:uncharacterized cupredoxin-like copper-binding protein